MTDDAPPGRPLGLARHSAWCWGGPLDGSQATWPVTFFEGVAEDGTTCDYELWYVHLRYDPSLGIDRDRMAAAWVAVPERYEQTCRIREGLTLVCWLSRWRFVR